MGESNDGFFGLSLSLGSPPVTGKYSNGFEPPTHSAFPLNLLHPHQNPPNILQSSPEERNGEGKRWEGGGIDINQPAMTAEWDYNVAASSPHSTTSTVTGKRSEMEFETAAEMEMTTSSMEEEEDGGDDAAAAARKKLRLTKEQAAVLEDTFRGHNTLNPKQKAALAKQLNLKARQVEVWFQNRRARTKLKQTEIDCEYLRRCCERLADENRRLHKEVNDLRALKLSPHLYMNMSPPTTLIMCPQCQRAPLSSPPPSSASSTSISAAGRRQHAAAAAPGLNQWTAILKPHRPQL